MFYCYVFLIIVSSVAGEPGLCYFHGQTLPIPMYAHVGVYSTSKNAVYLFGGLTGTALLNQVHLNKVYKWDLSNSSSRFDEIGTTPGNSLFFSWSNNAVLVNEQVFFVGIDHDTWTSGNILVYDLNTESFLSEHKTPMPYPLIFGCLTTNTTHIFMVDGVDDTDAFRLPVIQVYDVAADAWQSQVLAAAPLTAGGWQAQYCSLVGDALYVMGGRLNVDRDEIYRINTFTLEIEQLNATLPQPQAYGVSIFNAYDNALYLFGAYPLKHDIVAVDIDVDTLSVSTAFLSQQMYANAPVLTVNGSIYRFGGEAGSDFNATDKVEICDIPSSTTTTNYLTTTMVSSEAESAVETDSTSWPWWPWIVCGGILAFLLLVVVVRHVFKRRLFALRMKSMENQPIGLSQEQPQHIVALQHDDPHDDEPRFAQLLREWGLEEFVQRFQEEGYTNVRVWATVCLSNDELKNMGLRSGHIKTFQCQCAELRAQLQLDNNALREEGGEAEHKQPGAVSYSQAEGNGAGALTGRGVDDGNLVDVELVNMNHEQVTAEGDDDNDDDDDDEIEDLIVLKKKQQEQTVFIA